jgi:hypothetical protein
MRATRDGETMSNYIIDYFVRRNMFFAALLKLYGFAPVYGAALCLERMIA